MKTAHLSLKGYRWPGAALLPVLMALSLGSAAVAQERHGHSRAAAPPRWQGDIHRFHERDWHTWRSGRWVHGRHEGRTGWWWVAGGLWYFYPAAVYPYPNPYEPPAALVTPPQNPLPPPTRFWYYCDAARGYYPYVPACPGG